MLDPTQLLDDGRELVVSASRPGVAGQNGHGSQADRRRRRPAPVESPGAWQSGSSRPKGQPYPGYSASRGVGQVRVTRTESPVAIASRATDAPGGAPPGSVTSAEPPGPPPGRLARIAEDLRAAYERDPALHGARVAELALYPGLWALWTHRAAHVLHNRQVPWVPRLLSQGARLLTGIEIHPGARIGRRCFIDHGMGVVIGETAEIGDDVTIYHGVTLGARGFWRDEKGAKRHPSIGDRVVLGARSSVLGPVTVADGCRVGAHALVVSDVPAGTTVTALPAVSHDSARTAPKLLEYEI